MSCVRARETTGRAGRVRAAEPLRFFSRVHGFPSSVRCRGWLIHMAALSTPWSHFLVFVFACCRNVDGQDVSILVQVRVMPDWGQQVQDHRTLVLTTALPCESPAQHTESEIVDVLTDPESNRFVAFVTNSVRVLQAARHQ